MKEREERKRGGEFNFSMTETALAQLVERRLGERARICKNPADFKVCGVCTCIIAKDADFCPLCGSYRWHCDPIIVEAVSTFLVKRPLPYTAAVAPRIKPPELV
jgi:hypothetical protein